MSTFGCFAAFSRSFQVCSCTLRFRSHSPQGAWPLNANVQALDLTATDPDLKGFIGGFASGDYGYFVPYNNGAYHGKVASVALATFSEVQVLDLNATDPHLKGFHGGFASGDYGYVVPFYRGFGNDGYHGTAARFPCPQGPSFLQIRLEDY